VVNVTDPYGRILGFLDRSRYFSSYGGRGSSTDKVKNFHLSVSSRPDLWPSAPSI
jgi:hypothetical protein